MMCIVGQKTLAKYYARINDLTQLGNIIGHPSFDFRKNFETWAGFFAKINIGAFEKFPLNDAKKFVNELDTGRHRALCGALDLATNTKKGWVIHLLKLGADASLPCCDHGTHTLAKSDDLELLQLILDSMSPSQLTVSDVQGRNALHQVAGGTVQHKSPLPCLNKILKSGCNRYLADIQGRTWIHHAVTSNMQHPLTSLLEEYRKESPSEFRKQLNAGDDDGWTPLHWLCFALPRSFFTSFKERSEWEERLKFLLRNSSDPDLPCKHGWTPRHILILLKYMKYTESCELLPPLQNNSPINSVPQSISRVFLRDEDYPLRCNACHLEVRLYPLYINNPVFPLH